MASKKKKTKKVKKKPTAKKKTKKAVKKAKKKPTKKVKASAKKIKKAKKTSPKKKASAKASKPAKAKKEAAPKAATTPATKTESMITLGTPIPAITLENTEGNQVNLSDLAKTSKHLVLYFYPKDDTPGCTKEACDFRDNLNRISGHGAAVVGVSPDSKESHQNFVGKYNLNFPLLADTNHELAEKFGVWKLKQFMGNSYMGVERSTFLFSEGKLIQAWSPVKVEGHVDEVIAAIENKV